MDKGFIPKKTVADDGIEYVVLDNVFRSEETINYAVTHNFPIKFICTTYTCACDILGVIQWSGYELTFKKAPVYVNGRVIDNSIEVYCYKID